MFCSIHGIEILSGLAPSYHALLLLRLLFGIGMGGVWGLGASLAMESAPADKRGKFSGILQEGYAIGNLLAAVAFWTVFPRWGWRPMFFLSIVPALLTVLLLSRVEESTAWKAAVAKKKDWGTYFRTIAGCWKRMLYLGSAPHVPPWDTCRMELRTSTPPFSSQQLAP